MKTIHDSDDLDEVDARVALAEQIDMFPQLVVMFRRRLFRRHLELNVRSATPLLEIVSQRKGVDLSLTASHIQPPRTWPSVPLPSVATASALASRRPTSEKATIIRSHRSGGILTCWDASSTDVIGVRIVADAVELTIVEGDLRLETFHGLGRLRIYQTVPVTVAIALIGKPIGDYVAHPWLAGARWPVVSVIESDDGSTIVTFRTGQVPWRMPEAPSEAPRIHRGDK